MAKSGDDGSRIEAAVAGVHAEALEDDASEVHELSATQPAARHVHADAVDAVPAPAVGPTDSLDRPHAVTETSDTGVGVGDRGPAGHGESVSEGGHDDAGGGHGHGADPNAGVVVAAAPTPAWVLTAAGIALVTVAICAVLAVILHNNDGASGRSSDGTPAHTEAPAPAESPAHALATTTLTTGRA